MPFKDVDSARFVAVLDHSSGQTRSGLMAPRLALKVAKLWMAHGDRGVRIEACDGQTSWTPYDFGEALKPSRR